VCFVEIREQSQQLMKLTTGCKSTQSCNDLKAQNFVPYDAANNRFNRFERNQCKPDYRLQSMSRRFGNQHSVCRQCFLKCSGTERQGDYCFGGLSSINSNQAEGEADGRWFGYAFASSNWNSPSFLNTMSLGVPTWAKIHDAQDVAIVEANTNRYFWGDAYANTDAGKDSTDLSGTLADTMVYWGLQDQTRDWWASDLIAAQNSFFTKDTSDDGVEDSEAVFQ
jgi:hypothetical protein